MEKYQTIAISCRAYDLLNKLAELNPGYKKYVLVSELIEDAYMDQAKLKGTKEGRQ